MERFVYEQMAELDERHWWYCARREVVAALIQRVVRPPKGAAIQRVDVIIRIRQEDRSAK